MADVNPDELTIRLIDEGGRLLDEHGPDGLSLRRLAAACGTSTMTVYTRFGDKAGLLAAMYREGFRRLGRRMAAAAQAPVEDGVLPALTALGAAYRDAALDSPHLYGLMFGRRPAALAVEESDANAAQATFGPLVEGVRQAVAAGVLAGEPELIAWHLWVVAHGAVSLELAGVVDAPDPAQIYLQALALGAAPFIVTG